MSNPSRPRFGHSRGATDEIYVQMREGENWMAYTSACRQLQIPDVAVQQIYIPSGQWILLGEDQPTSCPACGRPYGNHEGTV
jgi:hypothetical protein